MCDSGPSSSDNNNDTYNSNDNDYSYTDTAGPSHNAGMDTDAPGAWNGSVTNNNPSFDLGGPGTGHAASDNSWQDPNTGMWNFDLGHYLGYDAATGNPNAGALNAAEHGPGELTDFSAYTGKTDNPFTAYDETTGALGQGGVGIGQAAAQSYAGNPDAWNSQFDNAMSGLPSGFGTDYGWNTPGKGELDAWDTAKGVLDTGKDFALNYGPSIVGAAVNPLAGLATSLVSQMAQGKNQGALSTLANGLAGYYGGKDAALATNMIGSLLNNDPGKAATTGISSVINSNLGFNDPSGSVGRGVSGVVGAGVNALGDAFGPSLAANGGAATDTSMGGGSSAEMGPGTVDSSGSSGASFGTPGSGMDISKFAYGFDPTQLNLTGPQIASLEPEKSGFFDRLLANLGKVGTGVTDYVANNPEKVLNGALQLYASYKKQKEMEQAATGAKTANDPNRQIAVLRQDPQFRSFDIQTAGRNRTATMGDPKKYGQQGGQKFFDTVNPQVTAVARNYARGGAVQGALSQMAPRTPHGIVSGKGGGQDDLVDARVSPDEYIFDADVVSALGDGSPAEGAKRLDAMREKIRRHKRSAHHSKIPPKAKSPEAYLKGKK